MASTPNIPIVSLRLERTCALGEDVSRCRFVSGMRREALSRKKIDSVYDLLLHIPKRYLDFSHAKTIASAQIGASYTVVATVDKIVVKTPRPKLNIVEMSLVDPTGVMVVSFFRQPWLKDQFAPGDFIAVMGTVEFNYGFKRMSAPLFERLEQNQQTGSIVPVHFVTEGLSVAWMRRIASCAVADYSDVVDFLPAKLRAGRRLMSRARSLRTIHFPHSLREVTPARQRLAYDEVLTLNLALRLRKLERILDIEPIAHVCGDHVSALYDALPFTLSQEQQVAVGEIIDDMCDAEHVMSRMLLGDVGTGKTAVATFGLACVADTNTQAAVMAPTSVLAQQYALKIGPILDTLGISWALLTGATGRTEREHILQRLQKGSLTVVFGTHALLTPDVVFKNLSLVVVDEQHRFGVEQRKRLRDKGPSADLLVMTATPIPRSLALSIYGDLDTSIIRHRPVAGAGVTTQVLTRSNEDIAYTAITQACALGQQVYVICPLVSPTDSSDELEDVPGIERDDNGHEQMAARLTSVTEELERLRYQFPNLRIEALHGRMSASQKDQVLDDFRARNIDMLVSTTVVEVGVDVPNATVMVVKDAQRFGLATLHQLRGRVGRGSIPGKCFLITYAKSNGKKSAAHDRLEALEKSSDGFELAQVDLRLRHEGEILGLRQSGGVALKYVDLEEDVDLIAAARQDAIDLLRYSYDLSAPSLMPLRLEVARRYGNLFTEVSGG